MAIKIPSSNIYDISINPVIDNMIDKVEAKQTSVNIYDNKNTEVYSKDIQSSGTLTSQNIAQSLINYNTTGGTVTGNTYVGVVFRVQYCYENIIISIPQRKFEETIYKIYDGTYVDEDGNTQPNIKLSINKYKNSPSGSAGVVVNSSTGAITGTPSYSAFDRDWVLSETVFEMPKKIEFKETRIYEKGDKNSNKYISYVYNGGINYSFQIPDEENLKTAKITLDEQTATYKITLRLLTKVLIYRLSGYLAGTDYTMAQTQGYATVPLYGGEKYELNKITFMGNKYEIDLQEQTAIIGDGNKVFSFDGNELIQTTNTPSIENKYQTIIDKWKKGKASAVISCPIADYYDNDKLAISPQGLQFKCTNAFTLQGRGRYYEFEQYTILTFNINDIIEFDNGASVKITQIADDGTITARLLDNTNELSVGNTYLVINRKLPMIFYIGDIVEPYIFTNKGDKPLAYNKDFSPKQFEVVGTRIATEQGVMQELTLLEYIPKDDE